MQEIKQPELSYAEEYLEELGLTWEKLKGKKVLDLGAGPAGFAAAARKRGIDVISFGDDPEWWKEHKMWYKNQPYVKGDAFYLPFAADTFDCVVSREAVKYIIKNKKDVDVLLPEIARVLKPNGEFRFDYNFYDAAPVFAPEDKQFIEGDLERPKRIAQETLKAFRTINPDTSVYFSRRIHEALHGEELMYFIMKKPSQPSQT